MSDTHGDIAASLAAVRLLRDRGAAFLIHCGDIGGEDVLDALAGVPSAFVFGNNDYDHRPLEQYACNLGIDCLGDAGTLSLSGKNIGVTHGDNASILADMIEPGNGLDYLFTGHSHKIHDKTVGRVRWINPGALYRAAKKTVAIVDLATDKAEWIEVPGI
ncbi:MAG: metallophosphoesterase family protein [Tepidisphaeraceae bacterium]